MTNQVNNQSLIPSTDVIQLTLTLTMNTAQVIESSVTVNKSPILDYVHQDHHAWPTYEMETLLGLGLAPGKKNSVENLKPRANDEYLPRLLGSNLYKWLGKNSSIFEATFLPSALTVWKSSHAKDASRRILLGSNVKKWLGYKIFDLPCNPNLTRGVASFSTICRPNCVSFPHILETARMFSIRTDLTDTLRS